ncbi:MAG TPA: alpha/beta fold hydrolase [Thermoanaerobaculia bacterium]|jgi:hypothetical protein
MKKFIALLFLTTTLFAADLPRRGAAGLMVETVEGSVRVRGFVPGGAAEKSGLQIGDVITAVDGEAVATSSDVTSRIGRHKVGETVRVAYKREGKPGTATITMGEWPRESNPDWETRYGQVTADGFRYRTIVTRPKGTGPFATVFIVQGVGCGSIDNPPPDHGYRHLVAGITRAGFATLRVDKPGTGDSEGGPCASADFQREVNAYRAGLASLKNETFVDQKNVFLFGHSMGGIMAPVIAQGHPLRGIVVYGTTYNSWNVYTIENLRRQMRLRGEPFESIADAERQTEKFNALFYVQKVPFQKILADHPEYREIFTDGKTYAAGKEGKYFQQLYDTDTTRAWKAANTRILALYGASDFLTDAKEVEWLAAAVNSWRPGTAKHIVLEGIDHYLNKAATQSDSMKQMRGEAPAEYNPLLVDTLVAFLKETKQ